MALVINGLSFLAFILLYAASLATCNQLLTCYEDCSYLVLFFSNKVITAFAFGSHYKAFVIFLCYLSFQLTHEISASALRNRAEFLAMTILERGNFSGFSIHLSESRVDQANNFIFSMVHTFYQNLLQHLNHMHELRALDFSTKAAGTLHYEILLNMPASLSCIRRHFGEELASYFTSINTRSFVYFMAEIMKTPIFESNSCKSLLCFSLQMRLPRAGLLKGIDTSVALNRRLLVIYYFFKCVEIYVTRIPNFIELVLESWTIFLQSVAKVYVDGKDPFLSIYQAGGNHDHDVIKRRVLDCPKFFLFFFGFIDALVKSGNPNAQLLVSADMSFHAFHSGTRSVYFPLRQSLIAH